MHQKCLLLPLISLGLSLWPTVRSFFRADRLYTPQCFCGIWTGKCRIRLRTLLAAIVQDDEALRTLGLRGPGSPDEIKRAFRQKVVEMHPDRQQGGSSELKDQRFREVLEAYARLTGKAPPLSRERKVGEQPRTPAQSAAGAEQWYGKDASRARWSQETGYNPSDLESIWDEIGYNPYTGEYHEPKASSADWQQEVDWQPASAPSPASTSSSRAAESAAKVPRPRTTSRTTRPSLAKDDVDDEIDVRLQILTYLTLVIACLIVALVPSLLSGQDTQNRLRSPPPTAIQRSGPPPPIIQRSLESQKAALQNSRSTPNPPKPTEEEATPMAYNTIRQPEEDWSVEEFEARQTAELQRWVDQFGLRRSDLRTTPEIASRLKFRE
eukprot:TRINITY_DN24023_c2_g2_i2.p1 TRINITY_DN24023_c2_g2~~TRINITY_DN24023_c2_g2_i2.p1  ORF type:complete len:381 (+),score=45.09 TRINITY_DN24023_c2_g2_i2:119-1261(+)